MPDEPLKITKDDFHRERGRFIDAFAGLEEAILPVPKASIDKQLAEEIKILRAIRNDLVHSQFRFVQLEGRLQVIAANVQDKPTAARQVRLLKIEDFPVLTTQISEARRKSEAVAS